MAATTAAIVAPVLTWAFLNLVGSYWAYWDMGVNPGANRGVLIFLYAPVMLALLCATGIVVALALSRHGQRTTAVLGALLSQSLVIAAAFAVEVDTTASLRWGDQGVGAFLASYAGRLANGDFSALRRRPG